MEKNKKIIVYYSIERAMEKSIALIFSILEVVSMSLERLLLEVAIEVAKELTKDRRDI